MAGHMGDKLRSIQNLEVIKTDIDNDLIYLKGSIPGSKNSEVLVKKSVKNIAEKYKNIPFVVFDILKNPFPDNFCNTVIMLNVLEHIDLIFLLK